MLSDKGRENFRMQLQQVVGSIQYTNDIDVHVALVTAPSFAKERAEKYYMSNKTNQQLIREYLDMFGFMAKNPNAMDIIIEEARAMLRTWGAEESDFLLCNSRLTFNMQMSPDRTSYITYGPDGVKRLRDGPDLPSYRGLKVINSRSFSLEDGAPPRDLLCRKVRVCEYYHIKRPNDLQDKFMFYDEGRDAWVGYTFEQLARFGNGINTAEDEFGNRIPEAADLPEADVREIIVIRPNIEHTMMGVIIGKGGETTGSTFWGQTELSVYDDSQHGIFGMSYKYNERAICYNPKNIVRLWDVAYAGYNGGKGVDVLAWGDAQARLAFKNATMDLNTPYSGASMLVMTFDDDFAGALPNPAVIGRTNERMMLDGDHINSIRTEGLDLREAITTDRNRNRLQGYSSFLPDFTELNNRRPAGDAVQEDETAHVTMGFQGSYRHVSAANGNVQEYAGTGHHGTDYVGAATVRSGKGMRMGHITPTLTQSIGAR